MSETVNEDRLATILGNPGNPTGEAGAKMLERMNQSHYEVTGWALDYLDVKDNETILDIGCGGGLTLRRMAQTNVHGKLFGIDHSVIAVQESSKLNADLISANRMEIALGSVNKLPYCDDFFDKIITVESFYFWEKPVENLKEIVRALKPEGRFLLVADIYGKEGLSSQALENIKMFKMFNPTPEQFNEMFVKAGFKTVKIHTKPDTDWIAVLGSK